MSMHDYKLSVDTFITPEGVEQHVDFMGSITKHVVKVTADQMEDAVRKKLMELGWTPPAFVPDPVLCEFYAVNPNDPAALVAAMERHILQLQEKVRALRPPGSRPAPWEEDLPVRAG
jgi:hypothetical protein